MSKLSTVTMCVGAEVSVTTGRRVVYRTVKVQSSTVVMPLLNLVWQEMQDTYTMKQLHSGIARI